MLDPSLGRRRTRALFDQVGEGIDAVLCATAANIYYFSGFRTMLYTRFTALLIRRDRPEEPILVLSTIDRSLVEDRVWSPMWGGRVVFHGPEDDADVLSTPAAALAPHLEGIRRLGVDAIRLSEAELLRRAKPQIELVLMPERIEALRLVKDAQELDTLREVNKLALRGMAAAQRLLEAGPVTELEIAVQLEADARRAGADGFGYPTLVSHGAKMKALHSPALPRLIERHLPVRVAFGPTQQGYTADVVRTFCVGAPPAELVRLQDGYLAARDALLRMIRPGVHTSAMLATVEEVYTDRGLRHFWAHNNIGHGVGLTVHEFPRIARGTDALLTEGMVLAIEPWLMAPDFGGYAQCDVVHVTATGAELLAPGLDGILVAAP